ncbi:MAG: helix-turn-helix domain-containing protein [Nanoarchaeota archaeon]|nr:helix-turn-helix domain-containing protein [Nanoarchaeota archaeon]
MHEALLEELGLSKNEAKVYLTLLETGLTTAGTIAKQAKIHRTNVYDALQRLTEKGIASYTIKDNEHYYEAADPHFLSNLLEEKQQRFHQILPELLLKKQLNKKTGSAQIYEGIKPLTSILNNHLTKEKTIYVLGAPKEAPSMMSTFLTHFHKARIKKKILMKHIYNTDCKERAIYLKKMPYTEVRLLPEAYNSLVSTLICNDEVTLTLWSTQQPISIHIKSTEIAEAYKNYFELLYKTAK